jgi:hypothetical protein
VAAFRTEDFCSSWHDLVLEPPLAFSRLSVLVIQDSLNERDRAASIHKPESLLLCPIAIGDPSFDFCSDMTALTFCFRKPLSAAACRPCSLELDTRNEDQTSQLMSTHIERLTLG